MEVIIWQSLFCLGNLRERANIKVCAMAGQTRQMNSSLHRLTPFFCFKDSFSSKTMKELT